MSPIFCKIPKYAVTSLMLLAILMFQWDIIDVLTPFLWLALLGLMWLIGMIGIIKSIIYAFRHRHDGLPAFRPIFVYTCTIVLAIFFPFTSLWLSANFYINKTMREEVIAKIKAGDLKSNASFISITLPKAYNVSKGGNIIIQGDHKNPFVFFFTYRGILDNYSDFL